MSHSGALCDERHVFLECPALDDVRIKFAPLIAESSGIMALLVWADDQPLVSKYIIGRKEGKKELLLMCATTEVDWHVKVCIDVIHAGFPIATRVYTACNMLKKLHPLYTGV